MMWGKNKYFNKKTLCKGKEFDSKLEAKDYLVLKTREERGEIKNLSLQVRIPLCIPPKKSKRKCGGKRVYVADFVYFDVLENEWIIHDTKGREIEPYPTKRAWILSKYKGFLFLQNGKEIKWFEPYGELKLDFETILKENK